MISIQKVVFILLKSPLLFAFVLVVWLGCGIGFFTGTSRETNINLYNQRASLWNGDVIGQFENSSFYLTIASEKSRMVKLHMSDKQFYPTRDSCNKKRDPPSGCILSYSSLFHLNMSVQTDAANIVTISGKRDIVISKISFRGNHTYIFDPVELGCSFSLDLCNEKCQQLHGKWLDKLVLCRVDFYPQELCIRVRHGNSQEWIVDNSLDREWKVPEISQFHYYDSDKKGCDYSNNWNSVVYGYEKFDSIPVYIRHSLDPFVSASAYTRGCSSIHSFESSCFGLSRMEARKTLFLFFCISTCLVIIYCFVGLNYLRDTSYFNDQIGCFFLISLIRRKFSV